MRARRWLAVLVAVIAVAAPAGQQPPQPTFRTEANYVRVDLYPTVDGTPITDLRRDEVEVLDNGVPQRIEQFERVQISRAAPQATRIEPNSVRASRSMLEDPRARVFVLFLDTYHVEVGGSYAIRRPLVRMLDELINPEDLVGVMTPGMAATDVTFARRTTTIDGFLTRYWSWGDRDRVNPSDEERQQYDACYPPVGPTPDCPDDARGVADEMVDRLREKRTLDALDDLVVFLRGVREERKAIVTITDGWTLFGPNPALTRRLFCRDPSYPVVGVDPQSGKLTTKAQAGTVPLADCDRNRSVLAAIDDRQLFRRILDEANRANASFYPIDPRGLVVFDSGAERPFQSAEANNRRVAARAASLRTLADDTDGLAVVNTGKLEAAMERIVADLTSYYLLGFYSSAPLDGKFHAVTVRVKRPGVQVRARRGYLAATPADVTRAARSSPAPAAPADPDAHAVAAAVSDLDRYDRPVSLRLGAVVGWKGSGSAVAVVAGEVAGDEWKPGAQVDVILTGANGDAVSVARTQVAPGSKVFTCALDIPAAGEYDVRVRARSAEAGSAPANEVFHLSVASPGQASGARFVKRGPSTAGRDAPAVDIRFRRSDTIRIEWPGAGSSAATATLLDRTGKPIPVPITTASGDDYGLHWTTAQLALAALAPGDYVVELVSGGERRFAGFRIVR